jgi:hypothetical protein
MCHQLLSDWDEVAFIGFHHEHAAVKNLDYQNGILIDVQ